MKFKLVTESYTPNDQEKEIINENDPIMEDYRRLAHLQEGVEITADNIDEWALNETACKYNIQSYDLRHKLLGEDVTIDQAARELEAQQATADSVNQIEKALDKSYKMAKRKQKLGSQGDYPNLLLISDAGFAKTSVVKQWAAEHGINLIYKDAKTMDAGALGGIIARDSKDPRYATRLGTKEFYSLNKPNSVLFLDEYNRAKSEIRGSLLTLVQDHVIWDPNEEGEMKYLENFLFTVAAINPSNSAYKGAKELDPAERSRFFSMQVQPDPQEHLRYLTKVYTQEVNAADTPEEKLESQGRLELAKAILSDPSFSYDSSVEVEENHDDASYHPLNYRSFKLALDYCDGTKTDLLSIWNHYCNHNKKSTIENILSSYKDIQDKANDAIKDDSESDVFKQTKSNRQRLKDMFGDLNI